MIDPTGHSAGAIGALKGIWGAALAEPTPYGEIIAAIATIFLGGVIIGEAISNSNSVRDDSETKEKIKDVPKPQPSPIPKKNNKKNKNDNDRTPPPPRPENREKEAEKFNRNRIDIEQHPENWELTGEKIEAAKKVKGGISYERVFTNKVTGDKMYQHMITTEDGNVIHLHFRKYGK